MHEPWYLNLSDEEERFWYEQIIIQKKTMEEIWA